ncbi:MAG: AMP-binding protein [Methylophaga sp.]|nr:AMP-binding protein [Methylophaga sp.]
MTLLWTNIQGFPKTLSDEIALVGENKSYSWSQLESEVNKASQQLNSFQHQVLALYEDNSPEWIIIDLACRLNQIILLPLPHFFSDKQLIHAIKKAGVSAILATDNTRVSDILKDFSVAKNSLIIAGLELSVLNQPAARLPENTTKITFTSGSTGQPKGVCLSNEQQIDVAQALLKAIDLGATRHLSILPFSTLLENIGGIYAPLLSGGSVIALPQQTLGFNGSSGFDLAQLLSTISRHQPQSMIMLPELLTAMVRASEQGWSAPKSLNFIAVGGSKVSPSLLQKARDLGLPVYEGYGLSECGSVVSLNTPKASTIGSIGKVLTHVNVAIEDDEIVVSGNPFLGYIGYDSNWYESKVYTGDLGFIDEQDFLHIKGRKKNLLISSFGRNINPEWVESELLSDGTLQHAVLFGDAKPFCIALIQTYDSNMTDEDIQQKIDELNHNLPNYAHVKSWARVSTAMTTSNGLITSNGRPVRNKIQQQYKLLIEELYKGEE